MNLKLRFCFDEVIFSRKESYENWWHFRRRQEVPGKYDPETTDVWYVNT